MSEDIHQQLGEIKGILQGMSQSMDKLDGRLEKQDERLRTVERKAVLHSVLSSGVVAVAIAFIKDKIVSGGA